MQTIIRVFLAAFLAGPLAAQELKTDVIVKIPPALSSWQGQVVDQVKVTVNGRIQTVPPGNDLHFDLPVSAGQNVTVDMSLISKGSIFAFPKEVKRWTGAAQLIGSGHVDYVASASGTGSFDQYPLVVLSARGANLDVLIDDKTKGTAPPEISRGISPNANHTLEWRSSQGTVCKKSTISLPANVRRSYLCDATTKNVEEK